MAETKELADRELERVQYTEREALNAAEDESSTPLRARCTRTCAWHPVPPN